MGLCHGKPKQIPQPEAEEQPQVASDAGDAVGAGNGASSPAPASAVKPGTPKQPKFPFYLLRKRLSSFSGKIQPISSASAEWAFQRSKSAPSLGAFAGGPLKRWWDWGVGWLLFKKPGFANGLEMNEEEVTALGRQSKGSWGHILYKVRSGVRRLVVSYSLPTTQKHSLPTTHRVQQCKPATFAYTQSFHNGHAMAH